MPSLSLTQQQRLLTKLSPAQIQVIKMLELPTYELQQRINEELQENPALEEGRDPEEVQEQRVEEGNFEDEEYENPLQSDEFDYDEYIDDDELPDYAGKQTNYADEGSSYNSTFAGGTTLMEHLKSQVYMTNMTKPQRHIAKWVLGNIDDDGFLRRSTEQLVDDIAFQEGLLVPDEEMAAIVKQIKDFDPPGVASADLQECLLKQLEVKPQTDSIILAKELLTRFFNEFSQHRYDKIMDILNIDEEQLKRAISEIIHLNQKPANAFTGNTYEGHSAMIIPDFYVEDHDGELVLSLNTGDIPDLHVSREYDKMLKDYADPKTKDQKEAAKFIRNKLDSANWFIEAIHQRNETLSRVMTAIVQEQKTFFLEGDDANIKPLKLQDIAQLTGYDASTISRACNSKYVQTEFGIFPLKHFFSESMTNAEGSEVSNREIKQVLAEVIASEDKSNPLTDDKLVEVLAERGYKVARRTITKYREMLGIPIARNRQQFV